MLCEPPHFRPMHLKAAIEAGKHVFAEKPVAVDAPGVRSVLATAEEAKKKNLNLVAGLCWRYDYGVRETMKRVLDGAIGDIKTHPGDLPDRHPLAASAPARLDRNGVPVAQLVLLHLALRRLQRRAARPQPRQGGLGDARRAAGAGVGRRRTPGRTDPKFGDIYDHHAVVYEYANGVQVYSYCRQMPGCYSDVSDIFIGTKGRANILPTPSRAKTPGTTPAPSSRFARATGPRSSRSPRAAGLPRECCGWNGFSLSSARERHHAVSAEVIAPLRDCDAGPVRVVPPRVGCLERLTGRHAQAGNSAVASLQFG